MRLTGTPLELAAVGARKTERERAPVGAVRGQAAEVREAEPARLAAEGVDAGRRAPVAERMVVDHGRAGEPEAVASRHGPAQVLELGGRRPGAHVSAL
jgi:hypothetical protein